MDRRTFLKTTTVAAGSGLALSSAPAIAKDGEEVTAPAIWRSATELTFASAWDSDVPVFGDAARRIEDRLRQVLKDRYRLVPAGPEDDADLSFGPIPADQQPAFAFIAGLPGSHGLEPLQLQAWLTVGGGQMLWDDLAAQQGFKPFLAGHTGTNPGLWASRPLWSTADLTGESIVLAALGGGIARKLGARALDLPPSELGGALANGRAIAVEWGNPTAALMLRLPDTATHFYSDGIHRSGMAFALNVRLAAWSHMDSATRLALENLAAREFADSVSESLVHAPLAGRAIANTPHLEIAKLPASISTAIELATTEFIDTVADGSPDAARIRDSFLAFRSLLTDTHFTS